MIIFLPNKMELLIHLELVQLHQQLYKSQIVLDHLLLKIHTITIEIVKATSMKFDILNALEIIRHNQTQVQSLASEMVVGLKLLANHQLHLPQP